MAEEFNTEEEVNGRQGDAVIDDVSDSTDSKADVAEYDKYNYDYKEYWQGREYENLAEDSALSRLLKKVRGKRIVDIGGSYGRLLPIYYDKFEQPVILDYSLNTLLKYEKGILEKYPNTKLVAANVYHLPFRENSFDGALMVRVLHHVNDPEIYYEELAEIMADKGIYVQEFANKIHLKARLKWMLKGQFKMLGEEPYEQPTQESFEGSDKAKKDGGIFMNFHPNHIKEMLRDVDFKIVGKSSSSFLRVPKLKKMLPLSMMMGLEKAAQLIIGGTNIAPSVFYKARMEKEAEKNNLEKSFNEILVCPECKGELQFELDQARCSKCGMEYKKHSTVWDFRVS
ncbi:MAG: class I SAM-dependent methyltransferase [Candidatus Dojkabacteria bacterium]|nr:MAG: class I SAM-dependent methyltransferase [Candidatus Dojkabacteria bacterium]